MLRYKAIQLFCCSLANQLINKSANYLINSLANHLFISLFLIFAVNSFSQTTLDNLTYTYKSNTNQLTSIADTVSPTISTVDLDNQNLTNYAYDASGQLTKDEAEGIVAITWTANGKVKQVSIDDIDDAVVVANRSLQFKYDAMGNRVKKIETTISTGAIISTYYIRNATGALISTYKDEGSGVERKEITLAVGTNNAIPFISTTGIYTRKVGTKNYELKDHLGSVRVVVNDIKEPNYLGGGVSFKSNIKHAADYYSYGMLMPGRDYSSSSYRYGYQGKEKDDELKNISGSSYDFGARLLDPRVGRWLSVDPKAGQFPDVSPYNAMANNPISFIDPDGKAPCPGWALGYLASYFETNAHAPISEQGQIDAERMDKEQAEMQMMIVATALGFSPVGPIVDGYDLVKDVATGNLLMVPVDFLAFVPGGDIAKAAKRTEILSSPRVVRMTSERANILVTNIQTKLIARVKNEEKLLHNFSGAGGTNRKGNFGEMITDVDLVNRGYTPLHNRVTDLDKPSAPGIDGVFQGPDGRYLIVDTKFGGAKLSTTADGVPQMSDAWINARLSESVGAERAVEIMNAGYSRAVSNVDAAGNAVYHSVDSYGKVGEEITNFNH